MSRNISYFNIKKTLFSLLLLVFALNVNAFAGNSVLSEGFWYKMGISTTGVYKLSYSELSSIGVDVNSINPKNIRVFHNGGGMLPTLNKTPYPDDLYEIPIYVYGESDGSFDPGDYLLFYARGPVVWSYNRTYDSYTHKPNPYTDYTYVFLTVGDVEGKRIQYAETPTEEGSAVDDFVDYGLKDFDEVNLNNMGCTWFGDRFDVTLERSYSFSFSNIKATKPVKMRAAVASKNTSTSVFYFKYNNNSIYNATITGNSNYLIYAKVDTMCRASFMPVSGNVTIDLSYSRSQTSSVGWIDYISLNAWRYLVMTGNMLSFRNPECYDTNKAFEYQLSNASSDITVWNVTDPFEPKMLHTTLSSSTLSFSVYGNINNEFVAFNSNSFYSPKFIGVVENQNLHAMQNIDYLIITHPNFRVQAERLKQIHENLDDLTIEIVEPQYIYNEFSCGAQDIGGIRAFIRMLYNNSSADHRLKYVLLFGDASYDMKNPNVCFIPTWESRNSWSLLNSIVTDDYFVCLDDNEGVMDNKTSIINIPIGRMPVNTYNEAVAVVNKIERYVTGDAETMGNWRNFITLICDDESSEFISNSEVIADSVSMWGGDVIVDKIYLDAYNQVATASGQRCPEMNEAITNRMLRGSLVVNYNGHGGEIGLGDERFLTIDDINSWDNAPMFPLFVTATCEFSRYDDHTRTSAGEILFNSGKGGAISMITTARVTSGSRELLKRTYRNMFKMRNGEYPTMGDIFYMTKQDAQPVVKVFVLFGDPALRLAYPKNNVVLKKINGKPLGLVNDTLKALSSIELEGEIHDNFGEVMTDFNGVVRVSVYDKENIYTTKGDNGYAPVTFKMRNSLLFDGKVNAENGKFNISFVMPKDINYSYGRGLISFYATDYTTDANGNFTNFVVGGYNDHALPDVDGPETRVFIDDTLFVSGGITNENPVFYALIKDKNGINTTGAGIGHDITMTLTGATNKMYNLNMYYDSPADVNDYGTISYRLMGLNEGEHHLEFKVWDIYNNSTKVSLDFTVIKSNNIAIENLVNAPNPMISYTNFMFEHNQSGSVDIEIRVYDISGQLVKRIKESRYGTSTRIEPIYWDGTSDSGEPLSSGMYIYNVTVINGNNEKASGYSKLVIAR